MEFQPQMLQDLLNNIRILYRCNDPDGPTTLLAFLNLDAERCPVNTRLSRFAQVIE